MHNESIIKLIGHRPVYRVEKNSVSGLQAFMDRIGPTLRGAPVIDQEQRNRMLSGSEEPERHEALA
ncbi:hypothetical protein [Methylomagnum sp.]